MIDLHPGDEHDVDPRHPRPSCVHVHWLGSAPISCVALERSGER